MTTVAGNHQHVEIDPEHEEGMPDKGHALVHNCQWAPGVVGPMVWFRCPRDRLLCGVPAKPSPPNKSGCAWELTGTADAPTLSPSVNCNGGGWMQPDVEATLTLSRLRPRCRQRA
jgi:hypothetical protein